MSRLCGSTCRALDAVSRLANEASWALPRTGLGLELVHQVGRGRCWDYNYKAWPNRNTLGSRKLQNIRGEGRKKYGLAPLQKTINEPSRHGRSHNSLRILFCFMVLILWKAATWVSFTENTFSTSKTQGGKLKTLPTRKFESNFGPKTPGVEGAQNKVTCKQTQRQDKRCLHGLRDVTFFTFDNNQKAFDSQRSVSMSQAKKRILNAKWPRNPSNLHFKVTLWVVIPSGSEAFEGSAAFSGVLETMEAPLTASRNLAMKASVCSGVLNLKYRQE